MIDTKWAMGYTALILYDLVSSASIHPSRLFACGSLCLSVGQLLHASAYWCFWYVYIMITIHPMNIRVR